MTIRNDEAVRPDDESRPLCVAAVVVHRGVAGASEQAAQQIAHPGRIAIRGSSLGGTLPGAFPLLFDEHRDDARPDLADQLRVAAGGAAVSGSKEEWEHERRHDPYRTPYPTLSAHSLHRKHMTKAPPGGTRLNNVENYLCFRGLEA